MGSVQLACVKHAASVRPEPGSNSPLKTYKESFKLWLLTFLKLGKTYGLLSTFQGSYFDLEFKKIEL